MAGYKTGYTISKKRMSKERKAQIAGQIFIYIAAVMVIGVIALVGYNALKGTSNKACEVEQLTFKSKIESLIGKYNTYGSVNPEALSAPCGFETICFVDTDSIGTDPTLCKNMIIRSSAKSKIEQNIFLISKDKTVPVGYAPMIKLLNNTNCTCIKSRNNNFYVTFEGLGSRTLIYNS